MNYLEITTVRNSTAPAGMDDTINNRPCEGSDPAIQRCFGSTEPFDEEFCFLAD